MTERPGLLRNDRCEEVVLGRVDGALLTPDFALRDPGTVRSATGHLRVYQNTHEGTGVYAVEDVGRQLVLSQFVDDRLCPRVCRRHDPCQHALDLM